MFAVFIQIATISLFGDGQGSGLRKTQGQELSGKAYHSIGRASYAAVRETALTTSLTGSAIWRAEALRSSGIQILIKFEIRGFKMSEIRFSGTVDHVAVKCEDLQNSVDEYKQLGFTAETVFEDWAMMRDARGFGIALLPPESKHPPHFGLKVETMQELEAAAEKEGRPIKPHRDGTSSFYTKGVDGNIIELIYYPEE